MRYQRSSALFLKAQQVLPGGVNSPVRAFQAVGGTPIFVNHAKGAYLFDEDGNRYIDYIASWGPMILGHAHPQFLKGLLEEGRLKVEGGQFKGKRITFHDPCYLGRANNEYEAPRNLLYKLEAEIVEMKNCKQRGLCCGAGGAQMFKEPEKGNKDINIERTEQALDKKPNIIATGCPFCNTMMTDGIKNKEKEASVQVMDVAELIAQAKDI